MREISFVKRLKFNFNGSVTKKALVIGDADNDQHNELVCANLQGDLAIFKDINPDRYAYATELGMVTACVVGDIINVGKNYVAVINTEGWLFIFEVVGQTTTYDPRKKDSPITIKDEIASIGAGKVTSSPQNLDSLGAQGCGLNGVDTRTNFTGIKLTALYDQRMPANCKELLLADLDGDGQNEMIVGLTDRVLRTYKWIKIGPNRGKFVGLYKWEFADQIGAVSLNPSRHENCQDIIVAQPGGTYAKLECFDKKPMVISSTTSSSSYENKPDLEDAQQQHNNLVGSPPTNDGDNVRTEYISKLTPEYHQLALAQMRNHHISTEVLGGIRDGKNSNSYSLIVIATLDGTLMLVNKDEILWSLQVDHQLFALAILESHSDFLSVLSQSESTCTVMSNIDELNRTQVNDRNTQVRSKGSQYFIVCAWNGKTYIIDEERNYLRFKFDEAVSAFTAGNYYFEDKDHASLVYATFNNQIVLYYDVVLDQIRPMYLLNEVINNPDNIDLLKKLETLAKKLGLPNTKMEEDKVDQHDNMNRNHAMRIRDLLQDVLYSVTDEELNN